MDSTNTNTAPTALPPFQVGETYEARSACNSDCVWTFRVTARTAKFVTLDQDGEILRVGVKTDGQGEWTLPFGSHSMAPSIRAGRAALIVGASIADALARTFRCEDCGAAWVRPGAAMAPGSGDDCLECGGGALAGTSWIEDGVSV